MSEVFDLCEGSFKKSMRNVQERLSSKTLPRDRALCDQIKSALNDSEEEIRKMSIECSSTRDGQMKARMDIYKRELHSYKKQYERLSSAISEQEQVNELIAEADKQSKGYSQNDKLIEGKRMMYQNLGLNDQISTNLKQQSDVLLNARGKMDTINSQLTVAHKLLNNIKSKLQKNKRVMWAVALLFVLAVGFVIYTYV